MRQLFAQNGMLMQEIDDSGKVIRYADISGKEKIPATDLCELCLRYGSDKCGNGYTEFYSKYFESIKTEVRKVLEIGVSGGCSLKMWHDYFFSAKITGVDCHPEDGCGISEAKVDELKNERTSILFANQKRKEDIDNLKSRIGIDFDIICDDGSHAQKDQQTSFAWLFPVVTPGGYYIIEDICAVCSLCNETIHWGQRDRINGSDSTAMFLSNAQKGIFHSEYVNETELLYLKNNIEWIKFHFGCSDGTEKNATPFEWGGPITCLIKKKA